MKLNAAALVCAVLLPGCAQFVGGECERGWYDTARFQQGWADGYSHRN